jgi:two-component system, chemotaxis family, CheB/CheR fusion protein
MALEEQDTAGRGIENKPVIVAIGASAGGVPALQSFFSGIRPGTGAAFIIVVHLDPKRHSELSSIISARTNMPVVQVESKVHLEANHVYVIPPDRRLHVVDHELWATEFEEPRGQRLPIDILFRSVAERLGDGFAVILSGAGSDGGSGSAGGQGSRRYHPRSRSERS